MRQHTRELGARQFDPAAIPVPEIPEALAALERDKACLWSRLMQAASPALSVPAQPARSELLTVAEVAKRLQVSTARVYQVIQSGELPSVAFGRFRRVAPVALDAWIAAKSQKGAA